MSAYEIKYTFGDRVSGTAMVDFDQFSDLTLDDEDEIVARIQDNVFADMSTGIAVTNLDSVVEWVTRKLREQQR